MTLNITVGDNKVTHHVKVSSFATLSASCLLGQYLFDKYPGDLLNTWRAVQVLF